MNKLFESDQWTSRPLVEVATLQRGYDLPVQDRNAGPFPIFAANGPWVFMTLRNAKAPESSQAAAARLEKSNSLKVTTGP